MSRIITRYAEVPPIYWVSQRVGRDYILAEQRRPDRLQDLPREIYLDAEGSAKAALRIDEGTEGQDSAGHGTGEGDVQTPGDAPAAWPAASDPLSDKRARLAGLRSKLPHYFDQAAVRALCDAKLGPSAAAGVPLGEGARRAESASVQQAVDTIRRMAADGEVVLDLELGTPAGQDLERLHSAIDWLRSLGVEMAQDQIASAQSRLAQDSKGAIFEKVRAAVGRHVLIGARFDIDCPDGQCDHYRIVHRLPPAQCGGWPVALTALLARERLRAAAKPLYHLRLNRSLSMSFFGTVLEAREGDGGLGVLLHPIAVFSAG